MTEKLKVLVYRHDDADGLWSAAIVKQIYCGDIPESDIEFVDVPVNYNKESWSAIDVNDAHMVYVLDFTFENMDELVELAGNKLVWIDHHKTAMERFSNIWYDDAITGIRSIKHAACELTWMYFYLDGLLPNAVCYIADRDMWKFEYDETKPFCEAAFRKIKTVFDKDVTYLLNGDSDLEYEYIKFGKERLEEQALRVENAFDRGSDFTFHGYRARLINTTSDISETGQYVYTQPEYDIAVMWYVDGDSIKFSLRSNSKDKDAPDCAKIAQQYGGGGHMNAAGYSYMNTNINEVLLNINGDHEIINWIPVEKPPIGKLRDLSKGE